MEKFTITLKELTSIMNLQSKSEEQNSIINSHGGIEGLFNKLKVDPAKGLSESDIDFKQRQDQFGTNMIPIKATKTFTFLIWQAVQDTTLIVLIICAFISLILSFYNDTSTDTFDLKEEYRLHVSDKGPNIEWIEGLSILITVISIVTVTAFYDWSKEKQFRRLQSRIDSNQKITALRNGHVIELKVNNLLVGDIVLIFYGHLVPADGIVIESNDLMIDESSLTGETDLIKKNPKDNRLVFSGDFCNQLISS
jgi:magnesium-transporting ATPase (P-type)